jgi:hypothetical protein
MTTGVARPLLLLALLVGRPPAAAARDDAVEACAEAVRARVHAEHPGSGRIALQPDAAHRQGTDKQVTIRGTGEVETREAGPRPLTFTCIYNVGRGAVTSARVAIADATHGGGPAAAASACQRAVSARVHDDHPAAGRIRWLVSSLAQTPAPHHQTVVSGAARIRTRDGEWRRFTFSCAIDDRSGRATRIRADF